MARIGWLDRLLGFLARLTSRLAVWHRWPFPLSVAIVVGHRANLRANNLYSTEVAPPRIAPPADFDVQSFRTSDGSFNDMAEPWMGQAGTRFGRNMPQASSH